MLIRNAKDSAGKAIEVWLRDGKIAAVGLGLLVPEGEEESTKQFVTAVMRHYEQREEYSV